MPKRSRDPTFYEKVMDTISTTFFPVSKKSPKQIQNTIPMTRKYIQKDLRKVQNVYKQTYQPNCLYYAINNVIQSCPLIRNKTIIEALPESDPYHGSAFSLDLIVPFLQFIHIYFEEEDQIDDMNVLIPKPYLQEEVFNDVIAFGRDSSKEEMQDFSLRKEELYRGPCVATILGIDIYDPSTNTYGNHAVAIIALYPYNPFGYNVYLVMDSHSKHIYRNGEDKIKEFLIKKYGGARGEHLLNGILRVRDVTRVYLDWDDVPYPHTKQIKQLTK